MQLRVSSFTHCGDIAREENGDKSYLRRLAGDAESQETPECERVFAEYNNFSKLLPIPDRRTDPIDRKIRPERFLTFYMYLLNHASA